MSSIAKSALWVTASEIVFNLSGFVVHGVLGRLLGPAEYGRYGLVVTLTTMVIILIGNGIPTAMAKYVSEYFETDAGMVKAIKRQAVILQTILIGAITLAFFLSAPLIAKLLGDTTLTPLFRLSTLIIPAFAAASFYFSYFTGLHRFNIQGALKLLRSVFRIGAIIGLAYFFGVEGSIMGYVVAPAAVFLVAYAADKFKINKELTEQSHSERSPEPFHWQKLVAYAWQIVVFFLAYELLISIDLYLVKGILHDDRLTGIYNASLTVGRIPYYIFYAMTIFLLPMVSRSTSRSDREETTRILSQSLRIILILLVPMVILLSLFALPALELLYGAEYAAGALPMSVLVFGVGFLTLFYVMSFAMNGAGKTKISMWIASVGLIANSILNYMLIPKYGILGSAIATSIASFVVMVVMLHYLNRDFGVAYKVRNVSRVALAGFHIYVFSLLIPLPKKFFILESAALLAVYFSFLWLSKEIKKSDLDYLAGLKGKRKVEELEAGLPGNEPAA